MSRILSGRSGLAKLTLVLVLVIAVGVVIVGTYDSGDSGRHVTGEFTDASPLLVGNDVRLDGVKVGEVSSMSVGSNGKADVGLSLDPAAFPLHSDATLTIKPVSLLGERYVDLDRGSANKPALAGSIIYSEHTGQSTDLDQVLNTVNDPTGDALAALVTMLGQGMDGNGKNIATTIKALAPAVNDTSGLMKVLDQQNALLNNTVDSLQPVASALAADDGKTLDHLTGVADSLLGVTATNQAALEASMASLPHTLATARATLASLAGTADAAMPTLQSLRPTTDNLTQISSELKTFADAADPALASAKPVLAKADQLLKQAYPVVNALQAAGPSLVTDAHALSPIVGDLTSNVANVMNFIKYWALTTNGYDGLSHYFRAMVIASPSTLTGLVPGGGNLGVGGTSGKTSGTTGKNPVGQVLGGVSSTLGGTLNGVTDTVGGLLSPKTGKDGSVTGLTSNQEQNALGSLLGLLGGGS